MTTNIIVYEGQVNKRSCFARIFLSECEHDEPIRMADWLCDHSELKLYGAQWDYITDSGSVDVRMPYDTIADVLKAEVELRVAQYKEEKQ